MLIISYKANDKLIKFIKEMGFSFIKTIPNKDLDPRIDDHPDLSVFPLDDKNIVVSPKVYDYYKKNLKSYNIIRGENVSYKYPYDASYNILRFKNFYIHNDYTEKHIKNYFKKNNISHLKVKQGYTRCSIIPLKNTLITSDLGIYKNLKDKIDIVKIPIDNIDLDGFDQGFIGGTCGLIENKLIFTGNIKKHKGYDIIKNICDKNKIQIIYPDDKLIDLGSILKI